MGGSSSKTKKTKSANKYELSHTVDEEGATSTMDKGSKNQNRSSSLKKKKGNSKNSVKIKAGGKSLKKSKSFKSENSQNVDPAVVADVAEVGEASLPLSSTVYRKKSSCPSCEAKDILLGKTRSRSGSEKSLRFSDFNKVLRKTRIYDWEMEPMDIPLYGEPDPEPDDVCYICGVYTGYHVRACKVCCRVYHDGCLSKIGHPLNEKSRRLTASNNWSCHQCASLNHLLTQEEVKTILEDLQDLEISKDSILEADYLKYCKHSLQQENKMFTSEKEQNSVRRFRAVAQTNPAMITWTQFLNLESIRVLNRRCKDSLVHLLTKAEIAEARKAFQKLDVAKLGVITKAAVQSFLDTDKSRASAYYPDDSMMYIDDDLDSPVTWTDFLRDRAIYFLGRRPNTKSCEGASTIDEDTGEGGVTFSSFDSIDADDEEYNTCHSDLDPGISIEGQGSSKAQHSTAGGCLDDSTEGQLSSFHTSTTMLDEFNSEMEKCCSRHELHGPMGESCQGQTPESSRHSSSKIARLSSKTTCEQRNCPKDGVPSSESSSPAAAYKEGKQADKEHCAGTCGSPRTQERKSSSPYNDSRHIPIPWEDLGNRPVQREQDQARSNSGQIHRRSEVIPRRPALPSSGQARAISYGKGVLAPAYGNLVGRVNTGEWGC